MLSKINKKRETPKITSTNEINNERKNSLNFENNYNDQKNFGERKIFENYLSGNFRNEKKILDKDKWTWRPGN